MKTKSLLLFIFLYLSCNGNAQGIWTQLSNFGGGNREITHWFTVNNIGYVGGGRNNSVAFSDLWQYDVITDSWNQKASKPGGGVFSPGSFVIGDTAYIVSGWSGSIAYPTVWAYVANSNTWIQKNNFTGAARYSGIAFAINGKGYVGTGYGPLMNDLWQYTPFSDSWTQKPNCPGNPRQHATALAVNGKGYFGMGYASGTSFNDWWEYDGALGTWTAKAQFPGGARRGAVYFEMNGKAYVSGGYNDIVYYNDLWEYNPVPDIWMQLLPNMPVTGRYAGFGFGFNGCIYLGTGSNGSASNPIELSDVWKYCLNTGINEPANQNSITISPNPSIGSFEITFSENLSNPIQFELYSTDGKKVFARQIETNNKKVKIELNHLSSGIYFYSFKAFENEKFNGKLIITN